MNLAKFRPALEQGIYHESLGALYSTSQAAEFFDCKDTAIRSQKKRLSERGELNEGEHWVSESNKVLWTFRGLVQLGMAITSPIAAEFRTAITDLLEAWSNNAIAIVPVEGGGLRIDELQNATVIALPATEPATLDIETVADRVAPLVFQQRQSETQQRSATTQQQLSEAIESRVAAMQQQEENEAAKKLLISSYGLTQEVLQTAGVNL